MNDNNKQIAYVVLSCDPYADIWDAYGELFQRFWPDCPYDCYIASHHIEFNRFGFKPLLIGDDISWSHGLIVLLDILKKEGYEYAITDMFVSKNAYWAAQDWYDANRTKGFNPNDVRGMNLHRISELESGLLGLDMNLKPAKWYYNVYSEDNLLHDDYGTFIHINRVDELEGHKIPRKVTIQMYVEYGFAVLEPKAVVFEEGI